MTIITISQYVDVDVNLADFDAKDLAKALLKKDGWAQALDKALAPKKDKNNATVESDDYDDIKELVTNFKYGKDVTPLIAAIAYNSYGLVC